MKDFTESHNYADLLALFPSWTLPQTFQNLGARLAYDYTGEGSGFAERLTRCYELVGLAVAHHVKGDSLLFEGQPVPEKVVHGMWQGPEPKAIGHAWIVLSNGDIWEPISACICERETFYAYAKAVDIETYTLEGATLNMLITGHFGPWHEENRRVPD